ncbi:hypothetical protein DMN91_006584 [Ooceraea biroi]|uniref:Uncharacterized protein n=1 Tax=Ooceraea biroi TaxID=2015173 RepID=A0A3L8DPP4_OOCBI|nr:hypothetical protein DMN91_006584 [Ooceraea biroi]
MEYKGFIDINEMKWTRWERQGRRVENECIDELWARREWNDEDDDIFHLRNLYGEDEWAPENWDEWEDIEPTVVSKRKASEEEEEMSESLNKRMRIEEGSDIGEF